MPVSVVQISADEWDALHDQFVAVAQTVTVVATRTTKVEEACVALNSKIDKIASESMHALQALRVDLGKLTDRVVVTEKLLAEHTQDLTHVETRLAATELEIDALQDTLNHLKGPST